MTVTFKGAGKKLTSLAISLIARQINVSEDEIHSILDVETAGGGFDSQGRIKILYEPHIFYRHCPKDKLQDAVDQGLAYPTWGMAKYPSDSYPHLLAAMQLDETAALLSASYGLGQILGENYKLCGYDTVQDMVNDFAEDEQLQLEAMVNFLISKGLDKALQAHDWATLARGYNGSQYAHNSYDKKLAAAYAKWQRIPDTPIPADATLDGETAPAPEAPRKPVQPDPVVPATTVAKTPETPSVASAEPAIAIPAPVVPPRPSIWGRIGAWYSSWYH